MSNECFESVNGAVFFEPYKNTPRTYSLNEIVAIMLEEECKIGETFYIQIRPFDNPDTMRSHISQIARDHGLLVKTGLNPLIKKLSVQFDFDESVDKLDAKNTFKMADVRNYIAKAKERGDKDGSWTEFTLFFNIDSFHPMNSQASIRSKVKTASVQMNVPVKLSMKEAEKSKHSGYKQFDCTLYAGNAALEVKKQTFGAIARKTVTDLVENNGSNKEIKVRRNGMPYTYLKLDNPTKVNSMRTCLSREARILDVKIATKMIDFDIFDSHCIRIDLIQ